jgi:branched-subunit amino acid transport protein
MADVVTILVAGGLVTYFWRYLGAVAAQRINPNHGVLLWVRSVATALIAALVVRFVYAPTGLLAETLWTSRAGALIAGVTAFFAMGRRIVVGVGASAAAMMVLEFIGRA